jgi:hypothetical protein
MPDQETTQQIPQFEVDGNMGYEFGDVDGWVKDAVAYITLLQDELASCAPFLHVHGWITPPEKVQQLKEFREALGIKGPGE